MKITSRIVLYRHETENCRASTKYNNYCQYIIIPSNTFLSIIVTSWNFELDRHSNNRLLSQTDLHCYRLELCSRSSLHSSKKGFPGLSSRTSSALFFRTSWEPFRGKIYNIYKMTGTYIQEVPFWICPISFRTASEPWLFSIFWTHWDPPGDLTPPSWDAGMPRLSCQTSWELSSLSGLIDLTPRYCKCADCSLLPGN